MSFPADRAARRLKRQQILDRALASAAKVGLTRTCQVGYHQPCHGATVCLCECHDPREDA